MSTSRPLTQKEMDEIINEVPSSKELYDVIWDIEKDYWREKPVDIWNFLCRVKRPSD